MKKMIVAAVSFFLATSCATAIVPDVRLPTSIVQGRIIHLWSVSAERTSDGLKVSGLAARKGTLTRPLNEHLHAEAIDRDGRVLQTADVPWNDNFTVRSRKSVSFNATLDPDDARSVVSIRLSVVSGPIHKGS